MSMSSALWMSRGPSCRISGKNKGGLIINVSSGAGIFALPMISLYCASKFALEGFSESLSYELASQNIVVKIVEPGGVISTNFGKRSGQEALRNASIADYDEFVTRMNAVFACGESARPRRRMLPRSFSRPPPMRRINYVMWPLATSCRW